MARAAIDVGSNSLLLTVLDDAGAIVHDEARVVGLGRGLGDRGVFRTDRMAAAEEVLRAYVETARAHGVAAWDVHAVATSAARRAINAQTFFVRIERELGLRVEVISGDEEARFTWLGAQRDLTLEGSLVVIDVGGGSTEIVLGTGEAIQFRRSLELGSVRLTEDHLAERGEIPDRFDPDRVTALRNAVHQKLAPLEIEPPHAVVGVAGTVTTLAAMALGLAHYDARQVHGSTLDRPALNRFVDQLGRATSAQRAALAAVSPERADYLLAGAVIVDRVLTQMRRDQLVVSDRGLRYGLLA